MTTGWTRRRILAAGCVGIALTAPAPAEDPVTISGLTNPDSVSVGPGGKVYVTMIGARDVDGDGSVVVVDRRGRIAPFCTGLDDPGGMVAVGEDLFVVDRIKVLRIDARGKAAVHVGPEAFPRKPRKFKDIAADGRGVLYLGEMGDRMGKKGAIYRVDRAGRVALVLDCELTSPPIEVPGGVLVDDESHLFVADFNSGFLYRYDLGTSTAERVAGGFGGADGLARDPNGRLFIGDGRGGRLFVLETLLQPARIVSDRFQSAAGIAITPDGRYVLVTDTKAGTLTWLPMP